MKRLLPMLLVLLLLSACGSPGTASGSAPSSSAEASAPAELPPPPPPEPAGTNPLTGRPMEEAYESLRPVAVMLNDLKAAQPQLGVSQADIIYEVPAEGGITRMLALYQSLEGVGNLGSIRSTRSYYLELALGHDALLVHAGGSPAAYADIPRWGVDNMDGVNGGSDAEIFWRDAQRRKTAGYEHSMLTDGEHILAYLAEGRFPLEHASGWSYPQTFAENGAPSGGTVAEHVEVRYSNYKTAAFDYDADKSAYLVGQYGGPYVDGNTGEQVAVTNVLALETAMGVIAGDTAGRLTVDLKGGEGTFFCGGTSVPIRWSKAGRNEPFVYTHPDGTPLTLGEGVSYVCLYSPKTGSLTVA